MPKWTISPSAETDAAVAWFRRRVATGSTEFDRLQEKVTREAFWMARVSTAQRAKRIQDSLAEALKSGTDFATWKAQNRNLLQRIPKAHLQTAFRNWTQTSYNAARVEHLLQPAIMRRRPYWVFDAVMDNRTTPVCIAYNGTVLPAGHQWFLSRMPPLHHNCRSTIRGLTNSEAIRLGKAGRAPADRLSQRKIDEAGAEGLKPGPVAPAPGFGTHLLQPWQPTTKDLGKVAKNLKRPVYPLLTAAAVAAIAAAARESRKSDTAGAMGAES